MATVEPRDQDERRGRPPVNPGEPSIEMSLTIEVSLHRQIRLEAQETREDGGSAATARRILREYFSRKKLTR